MAAERADRGVAGADADDEVAAVDRHDQALVRRDPPGSIAHAGDPLALHWLVLEIVLGRDEPDGPEADRPVAGHRAVRPVLQTLACSTAEAARRGRSRCRTRARRGPAPPRGRGRRRRAPPLVRSGIACALAIASRTPATTVCSPVLSHRAQHRRGSITARNRPAPTTMTCCVRSGWTAPVARARPADTRSGSWRRRDRGPGFAW